MPAPSQTRVPRRAQKQTKRVQLADRKTSVRLERVFLEALKLFAADLHISQNAYIVIVNELVEALGSDLSLTSALRCFLMIHALRVVATGEHRLPALPDLDA